MPLTKSYKETVLAKIRADREFALALFREAIDSLVENDVAVALAILRDLTHALVGFKALAEKTRIPEKSLHRMLSVQGNPRIDHLASVLRATEDSLKVVKKRRASQSVIFPREML
jgi:DNA-binding phage protein